MLLLRCLVDDDFLSINPEESQKMTKLLAGLIDDQNSTFLVVEVRPFVGHSLACILLHTNFPLSFMNSS